VTLTERVPDPGAIATGAVIVGLAVVVWSGLSLVRGESIQPLESLLFAVVFAVVYFGSLSVLSDDTDTEPE
jgi:Na+/H+ antiporter NhaC